MSRIAERDGRIATTLTRQLNKGVRRDARGPTRPSFVPRVGDGRKRKQVWRNALRLQLPRTRKSIQGSATRLAQWGGDLGPASPLVSARGVLASASGNPGLDLSVQESKSYPARGIVKESFGYEGIAS